MIDRHVVVVTGMSGAGRSLAANVLEDLGYYVVDNLPASLIGDVVLHAGAGDRPRPEVAVVVDTRAGLSFDDLDEALVSLDNAAIAHTMLFLDADDDVLVSRYESARRPHPVVAETLDEAIAREREVLAGLRGRADVIIDTSERSVHDLRRLIEDAFTGERPRRELRVTVTSFGFSHGLPRVLDLLYDVRFLPNPHWEDELRPLTGLDEPVRDFVLGQEDAKEFVSRITDMLGYLLPRYTDEGKAYLTIGVACTGGRHRSVAIAEELAAWLRERQVTVATRHRDIDR